MEMGNVSKRQQPDQIKNNSRGSPTGLQCSEKFPHPEKTIYQNSRRKNPVYMQGFELETVSIHIKPRHIPLHQDDWIRTIRNLTYLKEAGYFYNWGELADLYSVGFK